MSGSSAPAAPNYQPLADAQTAAANMQYKTSQDQLAWAKQQYADQKPFTDKVQANLLDTMTQANTNARTDRARYEQVYLPLAKKQADEASNWDSDDRLAQQRGSVGATVAQGFDAADAAATRQLESYGVNPGDARFAALNRGAKLSRAVAQVGAEQGSDTAIRTQAQGLRANAINVGQGFPGQVNQSYGTGTSGGTSGVGVANQTTGTYMPALGNPTAWAGLGNQSLANSAQTLSAQYAGQLGQFNANSNASSGWGAIVGAGLGLASKFLSKGGVVGRLPARLPGAVIRGATAVPRSAHGKLAFANGGPVPETGEAVPQSASVAPGQPGDTVPAMLEPDEMVIPKQAVQWFGQKHFQKLIEKAKEEEAQATAKPQVRAVPMGVSRNPTYVSPGAARAIPSMAIQRRAA